MKNLYITEEDIKKYNYLKFLRNKRIYEISDEWNSLIEKFEYIIKEYIKIEHPNNNSDFNFDYIYIEDKDSGLSYCESNDYLDYPVSGSISFSEISSPDWREKLNIKCLKEKENIEIDRIKSSFENYLINKNKAIEIAKKFAKLRGISDFNIEQGHFDLYLNEESVNNICVCYELRSGSELDDYQMFTFPIRFLVIDNWQEELYEHYKDQKEYKIP